MNTNRTAASNQPTQLFDEDREEGPERTDNRAADQSSDDETAPRRPNPEDKKPKRQPKPRFKLEVKHLKNSKKGLRLLYNSMDKLKLNQTDNQSHNQNQNNVEVLNQFLKLYKEWHFNLASKYELNYFISKCQDLGRESDLRVYMNKIREAHCGRLDWQETVNEEEEKALIEEEKKKRATTTQDPNNQTAQTNQSQRIDGIKSQGVFDIGRTIKKHYPSRQTEQGGTQTSTNRVNQQTSTQLFDTQSGQPSQFADPNLVTRRLDFESNMTRTTQHRELFRDRTNDIAEPYVQVTSTRKAKNYTNLTNANSKLLVPEEDSYLEFERALEQEQQATFDIGEDPEMDDMLEDFSNMPYEVEEKNNARIDEYPDPDDEEVLNDEELEYPIKRTKRNS